MWVRSLALEDPLEKKIATHSNILAWEIPWMEEPGGPQSMGSMTQRLNSNNNCVPLGAVVEDSAVSPSMLLCALDKKKSSGFFRPRKARLLLNSCFQPDFPCFETVRILKLILSFPLFALAARKLRPNIHPSSGRLLQHECFFLSFHIRKKFHCSVDILVSYFSFILGRGKVTGKYIHT